MSRDASRTRRPALVAAVLAVAAIVGGIIASSVQAPIRFTPVADATVDQTKPSQNFGRTDVLRVAPPPASQRAYIRFQVSGLDRAVGKATLRLLVAETSGSGFTVHAISNHAWEEEDITFANAPALGAEVTSSGPLEGGAWAEIDLTGIVTSNGAVSVAIAKESGSPVSFASREAARRPELLIEQSDRDRPAALPTLPVTTSPPVSSPATTTPTISGVVVVAAAGDIACDPRESDFNDLQGTATECRMKATADLLAAMRRVQLDAVLTLGDNQYEDGARAKYDASYGKTWGAFKSITRPAPGNHDYRSAAGYYQYFGAAAGDPTKGYYSWDLGGWHFIVLNSNCSQVGGCRRGSPQEIWLREDLAAHAKRCTLAYWHHPRFSSGRHGSSDTFVDVWQALVDFDADLVLTGHDHTYERLGPMTASGIIDPARGIRSFVVGTGGRSHYRFDRIQPGSEVRNNAAFGVLKLMLREGSYDWSFVPAPPATFTDSGTGTCH